ncbi:MAG TPA: SOS response-associated peptidase [Anaerolineales bacterium]|nr:SOS response-associated peptidase [Anaerolineales bacterium]
MCGRFTLTLDPAEVKEQYENASFPEKFAARFNIAPSQAILAIPNDGKNAADFFLWGLIPSWAKDAAMGARMINARGETLAEKPSYRGAYKYKRCIIPADGFYEWKSQPGTKTKVPYFIHMKGGKPFAFAGLWDEWHAADGSPVRTCTIVTTAPNSLMATIHDRMPVILQPEDYAEWLDQAPRAPDSLQHLIASFPADQMEAYPVSALVNSPANDRAECLQPA